jgi:KAP family P-loop domain
MNVSATASGGTSRDDQLEELITEALGRPEIKDAMNRIRLSEGDLRKEAKARLGAHEADILVSAESERQEAQRIDNEARSRAVAIDAEHQIKLQGIWGKNWKTYAILGICAAVAFGLSGASIFAHSPIRIGLAAAGAVFLVTLCGLMVGGRRRLERDRLRRHRGLKNEQDAAWLAYRTALLNRGVLPFIREVMNDPNIQKEYYGVGFNVRDAPGLQGDDVDLRIETAGSRRLMDKINAMPNGGNFGIAGPRGSGKTSVLSAICDGRLSIKSDPKTKPRTVFKVFVSAPVEFSSREFLLHLFSEICQIYIREFTSLTVGPEPAPIERRLREAVRRRAGLLSVLFFLCSIIVLPFAVPVATWQQYWREYVVPRLAKDFGPNWGQTKKDAAKVSQFVGKLHPQVIVISLILFTISWVLLAMWLRRLSAQASAHRENASRSKHLGWQAKEMLQRIKFQQSYSSGWSGTLKLPIIEGGVNEAKSMAEYQMSLPDIVASIKDFLSEIAKRQHRVIVAIDELDKVDSDVKAGQFLNDLKGIFGVPECFYLVSVSEEALSNFELRGLPFRDAFDSAFDEVAHFRYLSYGESRSLLERRVVGLPAAYICLCHCMAGGLPRDLIRVARELIQVAGRELRSLRLAQIDDEDSDRPIADSPTLAMIANGLVRADLEDRIAATLIALHQTRGLEIDELAAWIDDVRTRVMSGKTLATANLLALCTSYPTATENDAEASRLEEAEVRATRLGLGLVGAIYYSATLLELFTDNLNEAEIRRIESDEDGSAERLAAARQAFATSAMLAWPRISSLRKTWNMEVLGAPVRRSAPQAKQSRPRRQSRRPRPSTEDWPVAPAYKHDDGDDEAPIVS